MLDPERNLSMYILHNNGMTYAAIGRLFGISGTRVAVFCRKIERITRGYIRDQNYPESPDDSPWVLKRRRMTLLDRILEGRMLTPAELNANELTQLERSFVRSAETVRNQRKQFRTVCKRIDDRMELMEEFLNKMIAVVQRKEIADGTQSNSK